jgi:hypothetical protein
LRRGVCKGGDEGVQHTQVGSPTPHASGDGRRQPPTTAGEELIERDGLRAAIATPSTLRRFAPFSFAFRRHHPHEAEVGRGGCAGGISPTTTPRGTACFTRSFVFVVFSTRVQTERGKVPFTAVSRGNKPRSSEWLSLSG